MSSQANGSLKKPQINAFGDSSAPKRAPASKGAVGGLFSVAARYDPIIIPTVRRLSQDTIPVPVPVLLPELPMLPLAVPKVPDRPLPVLEPPQLTPVPLLLPQHIVPSKLPPVPEIPMIHPPDLLRGEAGPSHGQRPKLPGIAPLPLPVPLSGPHLGLPGIVPPPVTPVAELVPQLPLPVVAQVSGAPLPLVGKVPEVSLLPEIPKLPRVPTLPEVSLIPGVPNIPLLPQPELLQGVSSGLLDLGNGLAPLNIAKMFENSPAHLLAFPEIKHLPKQLLDFINKLPLVQGRFPFNAVVLLPVPKQQLKPPALLHAAIPGFATIDAIIHVLIGDVLWHLVPGIIRRPLEPAKAAVGQGLDLVSTLLRSWQVHWHRTYQPLHSFCKA